MIDLDKFEQLKIAGYENDEGIYIEPCYDVLDVEELLEYTRELQVLVTKKT